nr:hypothetical protein [Tanacetum cinerariifolium]
EVKNVIEQPAERRNRIVSLQNFRVIHKSSISLNTSQISSIHAIAPILSTKQPEYSSSMGYENLNTTPETESDEIVKSGVEELVSILSENEVTLEDKRECDVPIFKNSPICDDHSKTFSDSKKMMIFQFTTMILRISKNVVHQEEEEVDLEDISEIQDVVLREKLLSITRLISNIESLNDNPIPDRVLNSFESDNSLSDTFSPEFETFCDHTEETRSGNTTHANDSLPEYDSFCFEIEPNQERLINLVKNNISDDSLNGRLLEEADLFLASDKSIPQGIENVANDSEGDVRFLEELLIDDSILSHESPNSNFEDDPSIPRPPPDPPDAETDAGEEISVVMNNKDKFDEDYYFFMFDKVFSLLSAESGDTIFDPANCNLSTRREKIGEDLACLLFDIVFSIQKHYFTGPEYPPSPEFLPEPVYPEFMPAEDDILPTEEQPLPTAALPTTESPGHIDESDPEDDPKEDPTDYPADGGEEGDDEDESSDDDEDKDIDIEGDEKSLF